MSQSAPIVDRDSVRAENRSDALAYNQVFASLFTPSWMLGIVLASCLFLPSYRGCNGNVIRLSEAMALEQVTAGSVYMLYLLTWPTLFGLVVFTGTLLLAWSRNPQRASFLWWGFAGLVITHTALLIVVVFATPPTIDVAGQWTWQDASNLVLYVVPTIALPLLLVVTFRCCGNWYHAAIWMQLALAFTAAVCSTYVIPSLLLAKDLLYGGKLMIACSVGLVVSTVVQKLDGYRVLTRGPNDSSLRLSLRAALMLMAIGGLACVWVVACTIVEL